MEVDELPTSSDLLPASAVDPQSDCAFYVLVVGSPSSTNSAQSPTYLKVQGQFLMSAPHVIMTTNPSIVAILLPLDLQERRASRTLICLLTTSLQPIIPSNPKACHLSPYSKGSLAGFGGPAILILLEGSWDLGITYNWAYSPLMVS